MNPFKTYTKDPHARLDYLWDWAEWLEGDTIISHEIVAAPGITVHSDSATATGVTIWLEGGTVGQSYNVTCRIETAASRIDDRTNTFKIRSK